MIRDSNYRGIARQVATGVRVPSIRPALQKSGAATATARVPPRWVEYTYYAVLFYGIVAQAWGVSIPMAGTGTLSVLAARCVLRQGFGPFAPTSLVAFPLYCAASFLAIQAGVHGGSLINQDFIAWMMSLIVLQALVRRPGFLHRFVLAMLMGGVLALPHVDFSAARLSVEDDAGIGGNLAGANGFGQWFGFCAVYLIIYGLVVKRYMARAIAWGVSLGSLGLMGLSGSRGTLLAVAAALVVVFRQQLKRAFVPVLGLCVMGLIAYELRLFSAAVDLYATRGMEETGRGLVWPLAWARFVESPLVGVGLGELKTYIRPDKAITPHNSFLYLALSSGFLPVLLYLGYWWRAAAGAIRGGQRPEHAPFCGALLAFVFLRALVGNQAFIAPWATVAFLIAMTRQTRPATVGQRRSEAQYLRQAPVSAATATRWRE